MTTWSVVKDDTREKRWQDHFPRSLPRYVLLACLALVVVSLGVVLTPARPPEPAEPPFSEQARAAALAETRQLLDAGSQLGTAARAVQKTARPRRGWPSGRCRESRHRPDCDLADNPGASSAGTGRKSCGPGRRGFRLRPGNAPGSVLRRIGSVRFRTIRRRTSAAPLPATAAGLVAALADSGRQRLADAAVADGGMARLLAAVGTAQLLQASALAAGHRNGGAGSRRSLPAGVRHLPVRISDGANHRASGRADRPQQRSPTGEPVRGRVQPRRRPGGGCVRTEAQTIYGYQVALPRLGGDAAKSAAEELAHHDALLSGAESLSRLHCSAVPPREAGYALAPSFLASPAAGLGGLEAAALPVVWRPRGAERGRDPAVGHRGPARCREAGGAVGCGSRRPAGPGPRVDADAAAGGRNAVAARRLRRRSKPRLILVSLGILACPGPG